MTHQFARQEASATRLINTNGQPVLLVRKGSIVDPTAYPPTREDETAFAFVGVETKLTQDDMNRSVSFTAEAKFLLSTGTTEPSTNDDIVVGQKRYHIGIVDRVAPAGTPVLWKIIAHGGVPDTNTYLEGDPLVDVIAVDFADLPLLPEV